jgi:hypothetical protein
MIDIFKQIRQERQDFLNNEVEVVPGYNFSQYNTLKKIHLYFNSHYEKGDYEVVNGVTRKKIFHNISKWRCETATKMLDIDVKDFTLVGTNPDQDINVYLLEKELKAWLKKNYMGKMLNEITRQLPVYGSVVIKKTKKGAQLVDLRYLYNDQSAPTLAKAQYVNIRNLMSAGDFRKMKGAWQNVDEAIAKFASSASTGYDGNSTTATGSKLFYEGSGSKIAKPEGTPYYEVWERYGEVPLSWFTEKESDNDEYTLAKFIACGIDSQQKNDKGIVTAEEGLVLYKEQIKELPLKEVHYQKTEGRWLGIGVVEDTFEPQRRINEIKNQEAKAMEISSIHLFQSQDRTVASNVLTDLDNGQILYTKSPITPIATENRDLVSFNNASAANETLADRLTFSYDVIRGETSPATATLGAIQLQSQQASSVYDYKRENIGLFLEEFVRDLVVPEIEKEINKEHILRLTGSVEELAKLRNQYSKVWARNEAIRMMLDGKIVTDADMQGMMQTVVSKLQELGDKLWIDVPADFFKNLDYEVDIVITGENKNVFANIQNAQAILQLVASDPTLFQDPIKKKLMFKVMSNLGMHSSELEDLDNDINQMQGQGGQNLKNVEMTAPTESPAEQVNNIK